MGERTASVKRQWVGLGILVLWIKILGGMLHPLFSGMGLAHVQYALLAGLAGIGFAAYFLHVYFIPGEPAETAVTDPPLLALFLVIAASGLAYRGYLLTAVPIDITDADMLPNLLAGLEDVLAGRSPYRPHVLSNGATIPHYYPPMLWIPYLPFRLLGCDVRWLNVIAHGIFYAALFDGFRRMGGRRWLAVGVLILLSTHAFSRQTLKEITRSQLGGVWILYVALAWSTLRDRRAMSHVAFSLLLIARETALPFLAPYAVALWLRDRGEAKKLALTAFAAVALILLPFIVVSADSFVASFRHYSGHAAVASTASMLANPGLTGALKAGGLLFLQPFFQIGSVLVCCVLALRYRSFRPEGMLALCALSQWGFILFVSTTWPYLYASLIQVTALFTIAPRRDV